jgi:hypothetical protein
MRRWIFFYLLVETFAHFDASLGAAELWTRPLHGDELECRSIAPRNDHLPAPSGFFDKLRQAALRFF